MAELASGNGAGAASQERAQPQRRVLVVDDEPQIVEVLSQYLAAEGFAVTSALDGTAALRLAQEQPPDLVILDLMLPGVNGLEVCRALRATSAVPILMLTARDAENDKLTGFRVGADDYVTKPFSPREVVARAQAIMRRIEAVTVPAMTFGDTIHIGSLTIHPQLRTVERDGEPLDLTAKEFDLLYFLARSPRQVFTRQQLLDNVWDFDYFGDASTVTVHICRLRDKVERDPTQPRHVKTVWGVGYKFEP